MFSVTSVYSTVAGAKAPALSDMSLGDKIGQMVMAGVPGTEVGAAAERLIREHRVGGIILFSENVDSPAQVAALTAGLQGVARDAGAPWPLFVAVDQEGGPVVRIRDGVTPLPSMMAVGAAGSLRRAEAVARMSGAELAALGVNMNLAPILDVNNNPDNPVIGVRSFGEDPGRVAEFGVAYIRGLQAAGLLATAKHFPGHGDTDVDSHLALPTIVHDRARLDAVELLPFRAAIAANVDAMMTAHITFPAVDPTPGLPSTLSRRVLTDLLRDELGFDGLIITDALEMKGISNQFQIAEAAVLAVEAGADVVLIAQSQFNDDAVAAVQALAEAVSSGRISMERIDESVRRIGAAKARMGMAKVRTGAANNRTHLSPKSSVSPGLAQWARPESLDLVEGVARRAVTVVRDEASALPLKPAAAGLLLVVGPESVSAVLGREIARAGDESAAASVPEEAAAIGENLRVLTVAVALRPTAEDIEEAVAAGRRADTIVVTTAKAGTRPEQAELVRRLHNLVRDGGQNRKTRKLIVLAVDAPYDLLSFPEVPTYVACYGTQPLHLKAAVEVLFGLAPSRGRLPVTIPGLYPLDHGMTRG